MDRLLASAVSMDGTIVPVAVAGGVAHMLMLILWMPPLFLVLLLCSVLHHYNSKEIASAGRFSSLQGSNSLQPQGDGLEESWRAR